MTASVERFAVHKDSVASIYGVFDTVTSTWHVGDYDDALYFSAIPMWQSRDRAEEVAVELNSRNSKTEKLSA